MYKLNKNSSKNINSSDDLNFNFETWKNNSYRPSTVHYHNNKNYTFYLVYMINYNNSYESR